MSTIGLARFESNISFCTFRMEDVNALLRIFQEEKKKAAEELKRIYEQSFSANEAANENESAQAIQWKEEIIKRLKKQEEYARLKGSKADIFDQQASLTFTVSAGKKTLSGDDLAEILNRVLEPVRAVALKFECPDLKRKITLTIREHYGLVGSYQNRYEISGADQGWVGEVAAAFENIIAGCRNNRKSWHEMSSFLEPVLSLVIAGSVFLLLRFFLLAAGMDFLSSVPDGTARYLLALLLFALIWVFLGAGLAMKLSDYIKTLYPSVEILLNEERVRKRKGLYYVFLLIILPYFLNYLYNAAR
ncbi:MAG: hypothetical protein K6T29_09000 [Peptococcaceae bacterium]|nr:hypothetical protein [Peptococcaceae bacterium]